MWFNKVWPMTFRWALKNYALAATALTVIGPSLGHMLVFGASPALAAEPDTVIIGGPPTAGPSVMVDYGAIEEALGRSRPSTRLILSAPGKKAATSGAPKLRLAHAAPKKPKLPPVAPVATEGAATLTSGTTNASVPTAAVAKEALSPPAAVAAAPTTMAAAPASSAPAAAGPTPLTKPADKAAAPAAQTPAAQAPAAQAPIVAQVAPKPAPAEPAPVAVQVPAAAAPVAKAPEVKVAVASPPPAAAAPKSLAAPTGNGRETRLLFASEADAMSDEARLSLDAIAEKLKTTDARAQIVAFAAGSSDQSSAARRLSLKRALGVREFLISKGIRSQRMDIRALGNESGEGPPDRVDIVIDPR